MGLRNSALCKALDYLYLQIENRRNSHVKKLPTIEDIAESCGVSPRTVASAVRMLRRKGLLDAIPGRGIYIRRQDSNSAECEGTGDSSGITRSSIDTVTSKLEHLILNGAYRNEAFLPDLKTLCAEFGTSYRTLKASLRRVEKQGWISLHGRRYRLEAPVMPKSSGRILCLVHPLMIQRLTSLHSGVQRSLLFLEQQCSRAGIMLDFIQYDTEKDAFVDLRQAPWMEHGSEQVLGCVIHTMFMRDVENCRRQVLEMNRQGIPVALIDEMSMDILKGLHNTRKRIFYFPMYYPSTCGMLVGLYCLARGHTSISFVSLYHSVRWAHNRLNGLRRVYDDAGLGGGVDEYLLENRRHSNDFDNSERDLQTSLSKQVRELRVSPCKALAGAIRERMANQVEPSIAEGIQRREIGSIVDKIVEKNTSTAIVAANDLQALDVLFHLRRRHMSVPDRYSVIGFDNLTASIVNGLTSFDFNEAGIVHAVVNALLAPSRVQALKKNAKGIEIDGFIVERRTVRKISNSSVSN